MSAVARVALVAAVVAAAAARRGDGWARVLDALDASIDRLGPPADGAAALRGGLWAPTTTVLVFDGRAYVAGDFLARSEKCVKHVAFLASLCAAGAPVRNVAYDFHSGSSGTDAGGNRGLPPLVIAKRGGFTQKGILIPNPYYGSLARDWNATRAAILARGRATPWASRRPQAFWRGRIISHDASNNLSDALKCEYEYGNHARLAAAALSFRRPDAVDVKCTTAAATDCRPRDAVARPCAALPYTEDMARVAREPALIAGDAPVDRADYSAYRYVLNLPGATTGSYSKNLNHLWALGAVVMLWDAPFVEWCGFASRARARRPAAQVLPGARPGDDARRRRRGDARRGRRGPRARRRGRGGAARRGRRRGRRGARVPGRAEFKSSTRLQSERI